MALVAVLGLVGISFTANAQTAPATTPAPAAKAPAAKATRFGGTLTAVDATANTITISDKTKEPRTFTIAPTTKITKDKKPATLADFKVGDHVGGSYTSDASGVMTATSLTTSAAKAKAKTTAAATTPASH